VGCELELPIEKGSSPRRSLRAHEAAKRSREHRMDMLSSTIGTARALWRRRARRRGRVPSEGSIANWRPRSQTKLAS